MSSTRKERREQERSDAKLAKHVLPLYPDTPTRQPIRLRYARALASGTTPADLLARAQRETDAAATRVFAETAQPACKPGCAYCCKLYVSVRPHEARALAAALARPPVAALDDVRRRLAENAALVKGHTSSSYPKPPCALLSGEGTCIAYDARPFSCREYHSYDVEACRKADVGAGTGVPSNRIAFSAQQDISLALAEAVASNGGDAATYELQQALDLLLRDLHADLAPARELTKPGEIVVAIARTRGTHT